MNEIQKIEIETVLNLLNQSMDNIKTTYSRRYTFEAFRQNLIIDIVQLNIIIKLLNIYTDKYLIFVGEVEIPD